MTFNPSPMILRSHNLYRQAQFFAAVEGRTPSLVYGSGDPENGGYLDICILSYDCPFCDGTYEDEISAAVDFGDDALAEESYGDFRSFARGKQRMRKVRENKRGRCRSYKCRRQGQTRQRRENKRCKTETTRFAVQESQDIVPRYTLAFTPAKHHAVEWATHVSEELDEWVSNMDDDLIRYTLFGQNAHIFESLEPYVEVGEDFSAWCQRRIAEMRRVKESRIRRAAPPIAKPMLWKRGTRNGTKYEVFTGDASTTTLPTNTYDALGHSLLHSILTPPFRAIKGYSWFGEYEWAWHRNVSGCWDFGHAMHCSKEEGDWQHAPLPCPHCCGENGGMFYECYCREFEGVGAPEEGRGCRLIEWVGGEERRRMAAEDGASGDRGAVESGCVDGVGGEWDVVSSVSSEAWSVVDVEG